MMTVLATKIEAEVKSERENFKKIAKLIRYCANPRSESSREKCVCFRAFNFSEEDPSLATVIDEFELDVSRATFKDRDLLSHWVMSWKGGQPTEGEAVSAAKQLLGDLGYIDQRFTVAIHADTDHVHAHICACRVDPWTGKLLQEGNSWWKRESQKSLARIACAHGWETEKGNMFTVPDAAIPPRETVEIKTPSGTVVEKSQIVVVPKERASSTPGISKKSMAAEKRTGTKSPERLLQEKLAEFVELHERDFPDWNMADFHQALAVLGIVCERKRFGKFHGLIFAIEDGIFLAASDVCPALTYPKIMRIFGEWRDREKNHAELAALSRSVHGPEPTIREIPKIALGEKELFKLRKIPTEKVFKALGMEPAERNSRGRLVETAFDACFMAGKTYAEAADFLAEKFPDALLEDAEPPGVEAAKPPEFDKVQMAKFRRIDPERVFKALGMVPVAEWNGRIVKNAFDACFSAGMDYGGAARFLAGMFPDAIGDEAESPGVEADRPLEFTKGQLAKLRQIEPKRVFEALGMEPVAERNGRFIDSAFDVCFLVYMDYMGAARFLAEKFPDALGTEADPPGVETAQMRESAEVRLGRLGEPHRIGCGQVSSAHGTVKDAGMSRKSWAMPRQPMPIYRVRENYKFDDRQIAKLCNIPSDWVFEKLGIAKVPCDRYGMAIKDAFDVCKYASIDYREAPRFLDALFPEVLNIEPDPLTKEQMAKLRKAPVADVFAALGIPEVATDRRGKPITNAVEACFHAGKSYPEAMEFLAQSFPWLLSRESGRSVLQQKIDIMMGRVDAGEYFEAAKEIAKAMAALRAEKITVFTGVEVEGILKDRRDFGTHDFAGVAKILPEIDRECEPKRPGVAAPRPYFAPVSERRAYVCVNDDANSTLPEKYPPNAVIVDGGRKFFLYSFAKKYSGEFYGFLSDALHRAYMTAKRFLPLPWAGDAKIESFSWESPMEMVRRADRAHAKWKETATGERQDLSLPVSGIGRDSAWRKAEHVPERKPAQKATEILDPMRDRATPKKIGKTEKPAEDAKDGLHD